MRVEGNCFFTYSHELVYFSAVECLKMCKNLRDGSVEKNIACRLSEIEAADQT